MRGHIKSLPALALTTGVDFPESCGKVACRKVPPMRPAGSKVVQHTCPRDSLARHWPASASSRRVWQTMAKIWPNSTSLGPHWWEFADLGQCWPARGQLVPNWAHLAPRCPIFCHLGPNTYTSWSCWAKAARGSIISFPGGGQCRLSECVRRCVPTTSGKNIAMNWPEACRNPLTSGQHLGNFGQTRPCGPEAANFGFDSTAWARHRQSLRKFVPESANSGADKIGPASVNVDKFAPVWTSS